MSYQVIARKWRPQRFDDVVGQQAVTRTLRNAILSNRLAHSFVFAGPRGDGKTTTARILAKALNCHNSPGPTADPCGRCDACLEIADGRDMDVLEIDAATNTQVDKVREVIIEGLGILPVRDRRKIFIIDEVHQLSSSSFNALLKSVEEPPPHVVFMMATTELDKIPETIRSRSQVYEFRTIGAKAIADQLRAIVQAEGVEAGDEALFLIARDADGSMRDAESKLDQVIAFTGNRITTEDVGSVLGLVGREMVMSTLQAVADEDAAAAFALAGRAVEMGYDLRLVCRELSRAVRDLLVLSVDPSRVSDPEIAADGERDQLLALTKRFSREDLLRSFDLLTRAEADIRAAAQPRYHLEMALLRWIHLRKLVPLEDLIQAVGSAPSTSRPLTSARTPAAAVARPDPLKPAAAEPSGERAALSGTSLRDAILAEARKSSPVLYNTVLAQAQRLELAGDRLVLTFPASVRSPAFEKYRTTIERIATTLAGRRMTVHAETSGNDAPPAAEVPNGGAKPVVDPQKQSALKEQALADPGVQALLEVFPADIRDVEEM